MKKDKKGAELTIGTLIIIVLAVIVLVVLVLGFTTGWKDLWSKITAIFPTESNVGEIAQACIVACQAQNKYNYCEMQRAVRADTETFWVKDGKIVSATGTEVTEYDDKKKAVDDLKTEIQTEEDEQKKADLEKQLETAEEDLEKLEVKQEKKVSASCKNLEDWYSELGFQPCNIDCT